MAWYLVTRLLQMIPVFFGAIFIVYFLMFATSGDPTAALCGDRGCTPATKAALEAQYNLDQPFFLQFLLYLKGVFTLDLGNNFSGRPILSVIAETFPNTVKLALIAIVFEAVVGVTLGLIAGLKKGTWIDSSLLFMSLLLISVPVFVLGFVAQYIFGVKLGWLPTAGIADGWPMSYIMPAVVLASPGRATSL